MRAFVLLTTLPSTILAICFSSLVGQGLDKDSRAMPNPELPYYDWNVCPGEGCTYRQWVARNKTVVFDTYKTRRHQIALLSAGMKVVGITGVVITSRPGVIRMDRDAPESNLQRGNTILTFTYQGEGNAAIWLKGRYFPVFDVSFTKWPDGSGCGGDYCSATFLSLGEHTWWAQVKLSSGKLGWIDMEHNSFDGTCSF